MAIAKKKNFVLLSRGGRRPRQGGTGVVAVDHAWPQAHPHLVLTAVHRAPPGCARRVSLPRDGRLRGRQV
jgi:hypothetical protein